MHHICRKLLAATCTSARILSRVLSTTSYTMSADDFKPFPGYATLALHAGQDPEQWNAKCVVPPIALSTTYKQTSPGQHSGFEYSRSGNPTRNVTEACLAALDGGKHGMMFSSGLGAGTTVAHLLKSGEHIIAHHDTYGGSNRYFKKVVKQFGIETTFVDAKDPKNVADAMTPKTKLIWMETPTNPLMEIVPIKEVVAAVKAINKDAIVVVDNTFATSYFQRPLSLGADIVSYSLTKYMNGHSDVVGGALITNSDEIHEQLRFLQNAIGPVPSPFDCFLVNRGLKTLPLRMQQHMKNGLAVAKFLESDPRVTKVLHPGLESHPQYSVAKTQMIGHSGMVTFYIKGEEKHAVKFNESVKIFTLAESLGGYESLVEHPAIMTHASVDKETRDKIGISDTLIRLSCGLEDVEDLIADVDQALTAAMKA